jgi:prevent-host-death family protein
MKQTTVNIRELKSRLSHYLRLTKAGKTVEITERGTPIGRIVPTAAPIEDRMQAMVQAGLVLWNRRKLKPMKPVARVHGKKSVAQILIEERD